MDRRDKEPLRNLAAHIRDTGVPPGRDLWPEIAAAIDRQESLGQTPRRIHGFGRRLRVGALAACLLLALGIGWSVLPRLRPAPEPAPNGLAVVDVAIAELRAAMREDPADVNLSHLMRTMQKSRGQILIRAAENRTRTG